MPRWFTQSAQSAQSFFFYPIYQKRRCKEAYHESGLVQIANFW